MAKRKSQASAPSSSNSLEPLPSKKGKIEASNQSQEVFADPTYDVTFKMLFGNDKHKDILISLLNNLLNFTGDKAIKEVTINSPELQKDSISGVKSAVDVLCTTKAGKKIAVEMQRQYKDYFLARQQEYMAKIISNQVKDGQSAKYHEVVLETYVLSIGKQNIFRGNYKISDNDDLFEKTVVPMLVEKQKEVPGNKMYWKFYELPRFTQKYKNVTIDNNNTLKEQWLDFLINANKQKETPADIDEIIKKGYEIMKVANWSSDEQTLYWKAQADERSEIAEQEKMKAEILKQGIEQGREEEAIKIATNMIKQRIAEHDIISSITGLSEAKIDVLASEIENAESGSAVVPQSVYSNIASVVGTSAPTQQDELKEFEPSLTGEDSPAAMQDDAT